MDDLRPLLLWSMETLTKAGLVLLPFSRAWKNWSKPRRIVAALFLLLISQLPTIPVDLDLVTVLGAQRTISPPTAFELRVARTLNVGATSSLGHHITARVK